MTSNVFGRFSSIGKLLFIVAGAIATLGLLPSTALAHHALSGRLPSNGLEGFYSGLAHPMIGLDHFCFVLAIGVLAATQVRGLWLPIVFVLAGLGGTLLHLAEFNLPLVEVGVAGSLLLAGWFLARRQGLPLVALLGLGAIAGIFHGYAYGESIVGAEMTPLTAYLAGLTLIQLGVAIAVAQFFKTVIQRATQNPATLLRYAGFTFFGAGIAFLSTALG